VSSDLAPAFEKYHESQFSTVKLPGGSSEVLVSEHNRLGDGRYYDVESSSSFAFDHTTQKASGVQSYVLESNHEDLVYVTTPYILQGGFCEIGADCITGRA
jgi:capping protein alpha